MVVVNAVRRCSVEQVGYEGTIKSFTYFEIVTVGWQNGARCRTRRFPTYVRLLAYFNKLQAHGYLDESQVRLATSRFNALARARQLELD